MRLRVAAGGSGDAPEARVDWDAVRDAVGVEVAVILRELLGLLTEWARDAVSAHPRGIMRKCGGLPLETARDGIEGRGRGP
jgi:hypothetical protein